MARAKTTPKRTPSGPPAQVKSTEKSIEKSKKSTKSSTLLAQDPLLSQFLSEVVEKPYLFLFREENPELPGLARTVTKALHDLPAGKVLNKKISLGPLKELLVEGFDAEQVWEEIQLRNNPLIRSVTTLLKEPKVFVLLWFLLSFFCSSFGSFFGSSFGSSP